MSTIHTKKLPVTGLSCASCALSAEKALKAQPGVVNASVNFADGSAYIEYEEDATALSGFKQAVQNAGYDLIIEEAAATQEATEEIHHAAMMKTKRNLIWSALFSIPIVLIGMVFMNMPYGNYIMWALSTPVLIALANNFLSMPGNRPACSQPIWIRWSRSAPALPIFSVSSTPYILSSGMSRDSKRTSTLKLLPSSSPSFYWADTSKNAPNRTPHRPLKN
ncbi:lead, cadmium, zinc and mercury transporting ATPase [Geofilum rubicundum JCM 15548]|uniref:Lead, cadmium, zinc and mercury transporting ATPase n=1 Tax=Geofilum rubicundum JCM 15548 TaxID=1236989 RepID=A0A0E9M198_9BACT|nr:lead, cadmium, zinc and mercury transporting ATPase [Geofilum rubicundum JCM 15548]